MSRSALWALRVLLVALCAAAFAVACSGDDDPPASPADSPPADQQADQADQPADQPAVQQTDQQGDQQDAQQDPLQVVVSTQIIADWVRQIGGDRVEVVALVPAGADVHTLEISPGDVRDVAAADLVIINGATLEAAYEDVITSNTDNLLVLAEALEAAGIELHPFSDLSIDPHAEDEHDDHQEGEEHDDHDEHEGDDDHDEHDEDEAHDDHEEDHEDAHAAPAGRLLISDAEAASVSVIDLTTDTVSPALFDVAAPGARLYASPSNRFGFALALGDEDDDDRVHIFDGGIFLVAHGDHYDLVESPISQLPLELTHERPIHFVSSHGWTAIFADGPGLALLINEAELAEAGGAYEPIALDAGLQHGAALAVSEEHIVVSSNNPDYPDDSPSSLPLGVEVRDLDNRVIYDASNRSCPALHGESHNSEGALFGCAGGVLFLETHGGEYDHWFIENPAELREGARIGSVYGHHDSPTFFGRASYRDSEGFADEGIWLIDPESGSVTLALSADDPADGSVGAAFGSHGERFYVLTRDGRLRIIDPHDGDLLVVADLIDPIDPEAPPAFTIVGEMLYLADPAGARVIAYHLEDLEIEDEWALPGRPSRITFLGVADPAGAPDAGHDEHDEDEHGHEEDEDHDEHEEGEDHDDHGDEEDDHGHAHAHGSEDPHFWFDADFAIASVEAIADALSALAPAANFGQRAEAYIAEINAVDAEVRQTLAGLPDSQRLLVTFHDAFGYFARRYGLTIAGFVVEGPEQGISATSVANLIELIEHEGVTRIFREPQFESTAIRSVAEESGAELGIIWSQPQGDVLTYLDMLRANAAAIAEQ